MFRMSASSTDSGKSTVRSMPTGSAPALARSLAVTCTASSPISLAVPVMGSVDSTNTSSSASFITAQSSPTPAPTSTSGRFVRICLNTDRFSTLSGIFPIFIPFLRLLFPAHMQSLPHSPGRMQRMMKPVHGYTDSIMIRLALIVLLLPPTPLHTGQWSHSLPLSHWDLPSMCLPYSTRVPHCMCSC